MANDFSEDQSDADGFDDLPPSTAAEGQFARTPLELDDSIEPLSDDVESEDWSDEDSDLESEVSADDIQEAYLRALQAMEGIDSSAEDSFDESDSSDDSESPADPRSEPAAQDELPVPPAVAGADSANSAESSAVETAPAPQQRPAPAPRRSAANSAKQKTEEAAATLNPIRVIEAILFVGGSPITSKRLCSVLGGNIDATFVELRIDELNAEYATEGRPYEIRLVEGGYRLSLRPEFETVRNKVYGAGPREVRLSQDALEILALVAYQQPIAQENVEASGKKNAGNLLRQLIRRELIGIERVDSTRAGIRYRTTPRFLSLFGLAGIDELPTADELSTR